MILLLSILLLVALAYSSVYWYPLRVPWRTRRITEVICTVDSRARGLYTKRTYQPEYRVLGCLWWTDYPRGDGSWYALTFDSYAETVTFLQSLEPAPKPPKGTKPDTGMTYVRHPYPPPLTRIDRAMITKRATDRIDDRSET